jgi:autotransporter-associated beta strand protein
MYRRTTGTGSMIMGALQGTAGAALRSSGNGSVNYIIGGKTGTDSNFAGTVSDTGATPLAGFVTTITKVGNTTLTLTGANTYTGATVVQAGTVVLGSAAHAPVLANVGGADIQGGKLVLDYTGGTSPADVVRTALAASYAQPTRFSAGQIRSTTVTPDRTLGYSDNAGTSQVSIVYTAPGDANLDLTVNFADLVKLAQNYNQTGRVWDQGDFNYDSAVNFPDLVLLAQNYNRTVLSASQVAVVGQSFAADFALAQTLVPEPTTLTVLGGVAAMALRRRRA